MNWSDRAESFEGGPANLGDVSYILNKRLAFSVLSSVILHPSYWEIGPSSFGQGLSLETVRPNFKAYIGLAAIEELE